MDKQEEWEEIESLEALELEQAKPCPECGTLVEPGDACDICGKRVK